MNTLKRIKNKIKETRAFTLAEALVAIIIVLLVTSIVVAGIPAAIRAYDNVVVRSNAELLLSNTLTSLRNELSMARDITVNSTHTKVTYYNEMFDSFSSLEGGSNDIQYQRFAADPLVGNKADGSVVNFIKEEASDKDYGMHVDYESVSYSNGVVTFTNVKVTKGNSHTDTGVARASYSIRVITD